MIERSAQHATFVIERTYPASPVRLFKAFANPEAKARWFFGPAGKWKEIERTHDLRVGGRELVSGAFEDGKVSTYDSLIHEMVPGHRLVYSYTMKIDDVPISVSLSTVEIKAAGEAAVHLLYTEQVVFLDGYDDSGKRKMGSEGLFDQLGASLEGEDEAPLEAPEAPNEVVSQRRLAATAAEVFAAFADPQRLTRWWGPKGFSNTFEEFDFRAGGQWRFTMHGPDGKDYANQIVFEEIEPGRRIVFEHLPGHHFRMRITLTPQGDHCHLHWRQIFDSPEERQQLTHIVVPANEENFDRLEAELIRGRAS